MKVYLLISVTHYEGSDVLGVYADKAKAEEVLAKCEEIRNHRYDHDSHKTYFDALEALLGKDAYIGDEERIDEWEVT